MPPALGSVPHGADSQALLLPTTNNGDSPESRAADRVYKIASDSRLGH
jgi:hypothetical protein